MSQGFVNQANTGVVAEGTAGQLALYASSGNGVSGGQLGNVLGTATNDNAAAGYCGEFLSNVIASGSAVSLTQNTATNVGSLSLSGGDWDVWVSYFFSAATSTTTQYGGTNTTSATLPDNSLLGVGTATVATQSSAFTQQRYSVSGATTVYGVAYSTAVASTVCGGIYARRVR